MPIMSSALHDLSQGTDTLTRKTKSKIRGLHVATAGIRCAIHPIAGIEDEGSRRNGADDDVGAQIESMRRIAAAGRGCEAVRVFRAFRHALSHEKFPLSGEENSMFFNGRQGYDKLL